MTLTEDQEAVLLSVRDNKRTAVRSCHNVGKTAIGAIVVLWFGFALQPCKIITTATVGRQVKAQLWGEIPRFYNGSRYFLGGQMQTTTWKISAESLAIGFSTDNVDAFQGWHAEHILFVLDEAQGLNDDIFTGVEGSMGGSGARVLAMGNPIRPSGRFYECYKTPTWACLKMAAERHPNIVEGREVIPGGITREWVEEMRRAWGEDDPRFVARVQGDFPSESEDALIRLAWVEAALARAVEPLDAATLRMGVDVARYGADRTSLLIRDRQAIRHKESHRKWSTMQTAGRVKALAEEWGIPASEVRVDVIGLGAGVVDRLDELGFYVQPVNFADKAHDAARFANVRAQCYWKVREAVNPKGATPLAVPRKYEAAVKECAAMAFLFTSKGQIKIEDKEQVRARLGQSPDEADALALTFAGGESGEAFVV